MMINACYVIRDRYLSRTFSYLWGYCYHGVLLSWGIATLQQNSYILESIDITHHGHQGMNKTFISSMIIFGYR